MTEELKVKITVDTSALNQSVNKAKQTLSKLGDEGNNKAVKNTTESFQELESTLEQIKGLQFGSLVANNLDKIKKQIQPISGWAKKAKEELQGAFDFKNFDVGEDGFLGYLGSMKTAASEATKSIGESFKSMGTAIRTALDSTIVKIGAFVAAVAAMAAVAKNAFSTAQLLTQINAEAQKIGLSINAYREWSYVLEQVGVGADKLSDFIKTLSDEQLAVREGSEDATNSFKRLGLAQEQVINMSQEQLFRETVKRLQNVENEVERTSLAYQIFGEDAAELANVLRLTNSETASLAGNMTLLGASISQGLIDKSTALSRAVMNLKMAWQGFTNTIAELVMPIITQLVTWLTKAIVIVNLFLKTVFGLDMTPAASSIGAAVGGIGSYTEGVESATGAVEKLKRVTAGFDELNIITDPNSSSGGGGAGAGGGGGAFDGTPFDTSESIFTKAQQQVEEFQKKVQEFMDKWDTQIKIIGAALAALGMATILSHLGQAIGLGDTFLSIMSSIKKLSSTAIVITLQYMLQQEFFDSFIDGEGIKNWIMGLVVGALGSIVLYSMWGPTGLAIGLGVTAFAAFDAVWENGGVTNAESFIVLLTGIASAFGAIAIAWKSLGLAKITGDLGAFFTLLREGHGIGATLAAAFPGVANAISGVATALAALGGGSVAAGLGIVTVAIAGVVSVVVFLKENWDSVAKAFKDFFDANILPKFGEMKTSLDGIVKALGPIGEKVAEVAGKFVDWLSNIGLIDAMGKAFEIVGGVIFAAITGPIMGALNLLVQAIQGALKVVEGVVDIVSGVVKTVVALCTGDLQGAKDAVDQIIDGIVKAFGGLYDLTIGAVIEFVEGVIDWFIELWDELVGHSIVPDMIDAIVEWFLSLPGKIMGGLKQFVADVIAEFRYMLSTVLTTLTTKFSEMRTAVMNAWNNIKSYFLTNIAPKFTLSYWQQKFDTMRAAITEKLAAIRTIVMNMWNNIKDYFLTNIAPKFTLAYWIAKFEPIRSSLSTKLNEAKTVITSIWNTISSWFKSNVAPKFTTKYWADKFGTIKEGGRQAFNGLISIVESAINGIVNKLNTVKFSIPSWVPKVGGRSFGIRLSTVRIPRLATGGITTGSTLANIGENGREAVLPLDRNTQWMDLLADRIAARNQAPTKIVLKVGEKELGWATINGINKVTKQTGELQLVL